MASDRSTRLSWQSVMAFAGHRRARCLRRPSPSRHARRPHGCAEIRIILSANHYTTKADGGKGAARELVELILKSKGIWAEMIDKARA